MEDKLIVATCRSIVLSRIPLRISRGKTPTGPRWVGLERTIVEGSESCPSLLVEPPGVCEKGKSEAYSSWTHRCIAVSKRIDC
jgi:hypothetical protein